MANRGLTDEGTLSVLMQKYSLLKREIWLMISFYKQHVRHFQLISGALIVGATFVLSRNIFVVDHTNWGIWWGIATLISIISNYLILDIFSSQYALILLGERLATIEEDINAIANKPLLIWETLAAPKFYQEFLPLKGIIHPDWCLSFFSAVLALTVTVALPFGIYTKIWLVQLKDLQWLLHTIDIIGGVICIGSITLSSIVAKRILLNMRGNVRIILRALQQNEVPKYQK